MAQTQTQIATDIIAAISTSTSAATNFNVGSLIRSLADAYSSEAAMMEAQIESQVSTGIINAVYQLLPDMEPTGATGSTYLLTFSLSSSVANPYTAASGSQVTIPNSSLRWQIGQSITINPGDSVNVTATCTTTGTITNVPANTITQLVNPQTGVTVTNASAQPIVAGRDAETQTQLQAQVSNGVNSLHKGDESAIEAAALTSQLTDASGNPTEQVVKALEVDSLTGGLGYCFVFNGVGAMSSDLLTQTQNIVNGYVDTNGNKIVGAKAGGVFMTVIDAPETMVNVTVYVLPANGYSLATIQDGVEAAIQDFFDNLDLGQNLSLGLLYNAINAVQGVADLDITSPSSSLSAIPYVVVPSAPTATAVSGSTSLASGSYDVVVTFTNQWGETTASTATSVTLTEGQAIQVSAITLPTGATGVNYYLSVAEGSSTVALAASSAGVQTTLSGLPPGGAANPPDTNTAQIQGNAYVLGMVDIEQMTIN